MSGLSVIARNTGVSAAGDLVSKVASLAFYVVMARELGQEGFGQFMFALSLTVLLTSLAGFGTDPLLTRAVARDRSLLPGLFWNISALKLTTGFVLSLVAVGVSLLSSSSPVHATVALLAIGCVLELLSKTVAATFLAHDDLRPVAAGLVLQRSSTAAVGIAALLAGAGVAMSAAIYLGGALLGFVYVSRALRRRGLAPEVELSASMARAIAVEALPLGLKLVFTTVIFRIDTTLLALLQSAKEVGLYSAAYRALESTLFLVYAVEAALFPTLSRLGRQTTPTVGAALELAFKTIISVMAPIGLAFLLFAAPILSLLYGSEYEAAAPAMRWLGGAAALYGVAFLAGSLLVAQDRAAVLAWVTGAVMVENIVLNLIVIPRYSLVGAAATTTISEATLVVLLLVFALRVTGPISARRILSGPAIGSLAMVGMWAVTPTGIPSLALALATYVVAAACTERLLFPDDLRRAVAGLGRVLRRA